MKKIILLFGLTILTVLLFAQSSIAQKEAEQTTESKDIVHLYKQNYVKPNNELLNTLKNTLLVKKNSLKDLLEKIKLKNEKLTNKPKGEFETEYEFQKRLKSQNKLKEEIAKLNSQSENQNYLIAKIEGDILSTDKYKHELKPPLTLENKISLISNYDTEEGGYTAKVNGKQYWLSMVIPIAKEFKKNYHVPTLYLFPDGFIRFQFNGYIFTLFEKADRPLTFTFINGKKYRWKRMGYRIWLLDNLDIYLNEGCSIHFYKDNDKIGYKMRYDRETAINITNMLVCFKIPSDNEWLWLRKYAANNSIYEELIDGGGINFNGALNSPYWSEDKAKQWTLHRDIMGMYGFRSKQAYKSTQAGVRYVMYTWFKAISHPDNIRKNFIKNKYKEDSGTFTDTRDTKVYKWVKINSQIWMAENLAYLPSENPSLKGGYKVYDYSGENVDEAKSTNNFKEYGVLYNLNTAAKSCPDGWHLSTDKEWENLAEYISEMNGGLSKVTDDWEKVGGLLKSNTGWKKRKSKDLDSYGFSALPGGAFINGEFHNKGRDCIFWTSGQRRYETWYRNITLYESILNRQKRSSSNGFSVRCVKD